MKTYAHLQQTHSREQMKRVTFKAAPAPPLPLGNPAPAPVAEGEDSGRPIKKPVIES